MHTLIALLLLIHGVAHVVGFVAAFRLMPDTVAHVTTLLGGLISIGEPATQVLGILWLVVALAFAVAAVGALVRADRWPAFTGAAAIASLVMCLLFWPEARIGAGADAGILILLAIATRSGRTILE
jgi:hypothetical protein